MSPFDATDDWQPQWSSFRDFLHDSSAGRGGSSYLTEVDHQAGSRRAWTRAEWINYVASVAASLATREVRPGDTVAVLAGNDADALAVAFACWASGFTYLPLNLHESDGRLEFILRDAHARLLVHTPSTAGRAGGLGRASGVTTAVTSDLSAVGGGLPDAGGDLDLLALQVYTSGTTGEPKGVQLSLRNLLTDCEALSQATGWDERSRVLIVLPIHHVNGLVVSSLQAWYAGASAVLCDRFRSETFWDDVEAEQVTACSVVPTVLEFLLSQSDRSAADGFREVFCGAGPLMSETVLGFETAFGVPVRHLYGLSETTAVATMMPRLDDDTRRRWYRDHGFPSIGTAIPHVEVEVHQPKGEACPAGRRGEIVVRGATVMRGYAGRPEATDAAFRGGWFHTGDEGFWLPDPDGTPYFFITGRLKELIIRGGVNISPFTVDEVLNAHPAVQFGLAIPFENRFYGEEIGAYVVRSGPVTEQELLDFCAERLDFAYCPKVVVFGEDVPFTATGKAKRLGLKEQLAGTLATYRDVQFRRTTRPRGA